VLERIFTDETFFAFIAHADPEDDWTLPATWRKANPNYGVSVLPADLAALATKAANMPSAAAAFKQKRLNLWVNDAALWLSVDGWRRGRTTWTAESMRGEACYLGIDLSSKIDLTAVSVLFPPTAERPTWRLLSYVLTPAETLEDRARRDRAPYAQWVERGYLQTNPGNRIDQERVRAIVAAVAGMFHVQQIGIDPWNAGNLVTELERDGYEVVEIPQNVQQLSGPAKEFQADVLDGLLDDGGNELLLWCASNAVVSTDSKENIFPTKKHSRGRIDPIIAALLARKLAGMLTDTQAEDPLLVTA
jgi:phage terminase large subunit-like protein